MTPFYEMLFFKSVSYRPGMRLTLKYFYVFVLPVGLCEWIKANVHPVMFDNILRTFVAETLKIPKNIQRQLKHRLSYEVKRVYHCAYSSFLDSNYECTCLNCLLKKC